MEFRHDPGVTALLVVTGPPGSGKSTLASRLADAATRPSALVAGDALFGFLRNGRIDPWLGEAREQNIVVTGAAAAAAGRFVAGGYDTNYDGVVGPWFLGVFLEATCLEELDYVVLLPPVEVCVARVLARTGHGFTDEAATRTMHAEFERSVTGDGAVVARRHVVRRPVADAAGLAAVVTSLRAGGALRWPG